MNNSRKCWLGMCAATAMLIGGAGGANAQEIGTVKVLTNYGYGTPPGGAKSAKFERDAVVSDETLETPRLSTMQIRFMDETELTIGDMSTVVLDEFVYATGGAADKALINITRGALRYVSGKINKEGVTVETPTVLIGIRGTTFTVSVADTGESDVAVQEGTVTVTSKATGQSVSVSPGETASSTADGSVSRAVGPSRSGRRSVDRGYSRSDVGGRSRGGSRGDRGNSGND